MEHKDHLEHKDHKVHKDQKDRGAQGSQGRRSTRITWSTRSAGITRATSGAIRNAWSTLGIGSMRVRFNGGQV